MKFVVDAMFGRLARWLRMSGYDTVYDVDLRDGRLIMIAKKEDRTLVTRDRDAFRRASMEGVRTSFIQSLDFLDQLRQMEDELGVVFMDTPERSRCPHCNGELTLTDKKDIKAKVPERVGEAYDEFWVCQACGRVYWHGGHWKNIRETLRSLRKT